eukprot:TRINITY_DN4519_c0_g1_i1.p1 TRINITY_DN4519_c0_g1~~TRINITY_DN4519_c0_g1_i1.p1  ORF type:complete len:332 (-),score=64.48 TRINITY_DN4519_c0_g1_i1:470-1408(-)
MEANSNTIVEEVQESCPSETETAGREKMCANCPGKTLCLSLSSAQREEEEKLHTRMRAIRHKIVIMAGKGGVGKTSVSALIALGLAKKSCKVSLLDIDITGPNIPRVMAVENEKIQNASYGWLPPKSPHYGVNVMSVAFMIPTTSTPVVWRGPRKTNLIQSFLRDTFWGKQDFLIIDSPPGTSDEHISLISLLKQTCPDGCILVSSPHSLSLSSLKKEINFCLKMGITIIGVIENMSSFVCPCCNETSEIFGETSQVKALAESKGLRFLGSIPLDPRLGQCCDEGKNPYEELSASPTITEFNRICDLLHHLP